MSISKTLFDVTRIIPETEETGWGTQMTNWIVAVNDALNALVTLVAAVPFPVIAGVDSALAAGATLTVTQPCHRVAGTGGAVTLDGTTALSAGSKDGQTLLLLGTSDANTVAIPDGAGVDQNGDITLSLGHAIRYRWNATRALWEELGRNN